MPQTIVFVHSPAVGVGVGVGVEDSGEPKSVLIAYVDESYDRDYYFIGAAVATITQWEDLSLRLQEIRDRTAMEHGVSASIEFHAHELMGGSGAWKPFRGRHREAAGIYIAPLRAAREAGVRYIFRGVDVGRLNARYSYPRPPHAVVLGHLLERIDEYTVKTGQQEQTIVVADEIGTQDDHQRAIAGYQAYGTDGYRSSKLEHISAPINFASSGGSDGLQAVDFAVYVHYRRERVLNAHPAAKRTLARQWKEIGPVVEHSWEWRPWERTKAPQAGPSAGNAPVTGPSWNKHIAVRLKSASPLRFAGRVSERAGLMRAH